MIDTQSVSFDQIRQDFIDYVESIPDAARWKDFYPAGAGTTFVELLAGMATYHANKIIFTRRECFLSTALIRSSNIAAVESLGYSAGRGTNYHINLTLISNSNETITKFSEIGTLDEYSLYTANAVSLSSGSETTIEVVYGELIGLEPDYVEKEVNTNSQNIFRFTETDISEDYELSLYSNGSETVLPVTEYYKEMIDDKYLVMTNFLDSVDVTYLNNGFFEIDISNNVIILSTNYGGPETITIPTGYYIGSRLAQEIQLGISNNWTLTAGTSVYSVTYNNSNRMFTINSGDGYISYIKDGSTIGLTIGFTVDKNMSSSISSDEFALSPGSYAYKVGDKLRFKYIKYMEPSLSINLSSITTDYGTVVNATIGTYELRESITDMKINGPIHHEIQKVIRARSDYKKALRLLIPGCVDTNSKDDTQYGNPNAVVNVTYVTSNDVSMTQSEKAVIMSELNEYRPFGIPLPRIESIDCTSAIWLSDFTIRYTVSDNSSFIAGDYMIVTGFSNVYNNGRLLVNEVVGTTSVDVYNPYRDSSLLDETTTAYITKEGITDPIKITIPVSITLRLKSASAVAYTLAINSEITTIFKNYEQKLGIAIRLDELENAIEFMEISGVYYIKRARVSFDTQNEVYQLAWNEYADLTFTTPTIETII